MTAMQTLSPGGRGVLRETGRDTGPPQRVSVSGKFFRLGEATWYVKGLTYGPFAANADGYFLPQPQQVRRDFAQMAALGATALRVYHPPPREFLDDALGCGLRVLIDVPWQKHRCFLEDWSSQREAIEHVSRAARELGAHPAVMGISVANEIPRDVVRFYGARRIERFVAGLLDAVKQEAPDCLTTYTNYPSTEFLNPGPLDFLSFNVYLEDPVALAAYLDRLQHIAGARPLVLGECGLDSLHAGAAAQAKLLQGALTQVYRRGLAGCFVFAYTDDWFTGGHAVENWAFGLTDRQRYEKPAARVVSDIWSRVPQVRHEDLPAVSVIVCSYNGAATLEECLNSLEKLDYPDYEVILVDDGSTDRTPQIAAKYPSVRYIRQTNCGLSAARNAGAQAARGQIVAYIDDDCVADSKWLLYLAMAMRDQQVPAVGGPNLPPASDNWIARCVAASPGGPSHVMLDDRLAEHVPGCNMAFDRRKLLQLGAFDPQFWVAGDDVDVCWRMLDANLKIGYAPAGFVWHHRQATVRGYLKQQKGYGRAEAMLQFKHPRRFNTAGAARWNGIIYGDGAVGLPLRPPPTYYGKFGTGLFQMIYRHNQYSPWAYFLLLEWHMVAALLLILSAAWHPLVVLAAAMEALSLASAVRWSFAAPLPTARPRWCRLLVFALYFIQPAVRSAHRYAWRLAHKRLSPPCQPARLIAAHVKRISLMCCDLYWQSRAAVGRERLLEELTRSARATNWSGIFGEEWADWDMMLCGDWWNDVRVHTATEELGGPRRFTRVRWMLRPTAMSKVAVCVMFATTIAAVLGERTWALATVGALWLVLGAFFVRSARRCFRAAAELVWRSGLVAQLEPVPARAQRSTRTCPVAEPTIEEPESAGVLAG